MSKALGTFVLCFMPFALSGSTPPNLLEIIQKNGVLNIISSNGPTTYYEGSFGYTGFEYELAEAFAEELGVELTIYDQPQLSQILDSVAQQQAHFASNGLTITEQRKHTFDFSYPYLEVTQQVIYRRGDPRPKTIEDIIGKDIVVTVRSSHAENLQRLKIDYPELTWRELENAEPIDRLEMVHNGEAEITLVDSSAYKSKSVLYPKARPGFDISAPEPLAWLFPKHTDQSLLLTANRFLQAYEASGELAALQKKYFEQEAIDVGGALAFNARLETRLPKWERFFKESAEEFELDWLLLAAISYQESLWNHRAKSYTGVRGLMMLTQITAREMGIKSRIDPQQSIYGGAKYFSRMLNRVPERIKSPDRIWLALAAYNVGFGHLEDARIITQRQGGDPDLWDDVKERLPLLAKKKYYKDTKHGFARGWEPVTYVENIRKYYDILVLRDNTEQKRVALAEGPNSKIQNDS